jgi:hypothetical protein
MPESRCLVVEEEEGEAKISSLNSIQRTFFILFQTLILQFGAIPTGMGRSFLCSVFIAILFSALIIVPVSLGAAPAYAQGPSIAPDDNNQGPPGPRLPLPFGQQPFAQPSNFSFGPIASIQNNESGQPAWVVVGFWRGNLLSFNETTTATTTTENGDGNASSLAAAAVFNANLRMIMINGSEAHTHVITNFRLSNVSSNENGTTTYTGNSTVSMPEAAIADVPTTIKVSGEIISIFPDPSKVNEHYGNTPIYGAVSVEEEGPRRPPHGPAPLS